MSKKISDTYKKAAGHVDPSAAASGNPIRGEVVEVKVADLVPGDNRELIEAKVENLRRSIKLCGQIEPITINGDNKVIAGYHRYEAFKRDGYETIRATRRTDLTPKDETQIQIHENTMRGELTFRQKMAACEWITKNLAGAVGNPNLISQNFGKLESKKGAHTEDLVVEHNIFPNPETFRQAKIVNKKCCPAVLDELDKGADGALTIYRAYKSFSDVPEVRQKSLLTRMVAKRIAEEVDDTPKPTRVAAEKVRLTAEASKYSFPDDDADKYEVVHVAPDWKAPSVLKKTKALPISKFIFSDAAVFIDCPSGKIDLALELLDHWKLHYLGFFVVDCPKYAIVPEFGYVSRELHCVVYGSADKTLPLEPIGDTRIEPYQRADDPHRAVLNALGTYFGKELRGRLLDMTSTVPVDGWDVLNLKFLKNN